MKTRHGNGNQPRVVTWLGLWLLMRRYTYKRFAKICICSENAVERWAIHRRGMSVRSARIMRALFPDCPISIRGGMVPLLSEPLPYNARTVKLYRFLLAFVGQRSHASPSRLWPLALEKARLGDRSEPSEGAGPAGQPNP